MFVQHLIFNSTHASQETWLGGSDAQENGYWYWIDGTQFRYTNWCPGQPSNSYYEQCLRMNFGGGADMRRGRTERSGFEGRHQDGCWEKMTIIIFCYCHSI
ncbi:galactose-specific lectin nattectin-like [Simochromis diagramma]|uniref:galactose-specific lectin nattectin-like n=1 Tax=Simochromis diagramma TaxID=43689 RepID=UPI001A7E84A7|nr:galactose-specific lectin nattectin-like [Simochromis diagramma]